MHVFPLDDVVAHELDGDGCACGPDLEPVFEEDGSVSWLVSHHSLDGRELHELHESPGIGRSVGPGRQGGGEGGAPAGRERHP